MRQERQDSRDGRIDWSAGVASHSDGYPGEFPGGRHVLRIIDPARQASHPLNGTGWPTEEAAWQALRNAGLL